MISEKPVSRKNFETRSKIFSVKNLCVFNHQHVPAVNNVSFEVNAGEVFGIAGVEGNGQAELISAITGAAKPASGEIHYDGKNISDINTAKFRKLGIGYIPEDRNTMGASLNTSIEENLILNVINDKKMKTLGILNHRSICKYSDALIKKFKIKTDDAKLPARSMSGGNVQKMVVAREINENPQFIIACQPTRGVDISSIEFIHNHLLEQRNNGAAVLLVTTELTEILALSDRIGIIYNGEIVAVLNNDGSLSEEDLGFYMLGIKRECNTTSETGVS